MIKTVSPSPSKQPEISLIVPLYNERDNLLPLTEMVLSALQTLGIPFEVLYVDDGSNDGSEEIYQEICHQHPEVRVIQLRRNFGQTAAMSAGFDHARGSVILVMDGDLQNDPQDIPSLLAKLEEGFDVVNGWRRERQDRWLTRILPSKMANWLIGRITGVRLHDYGCSLKAYRAEVIKNVPLYGELHRFIPALASIYGARITEIPVNHHPRRYGKSKYTLSRTFRVIMDLIMVSFLKSFGQRPFHIFGPLGTLLLLMGILIDGYLTLEKLLYSVRLSERPLLLLGTLLILVGLQIIGIGILAEIQIRTYYESQRKPIYAVRNIMN
jgi:glycosyltransferase involved in cell wall biosynthesis